MSTYIHVYGFVSDRKTSIFRPGNHVMFLVIPGLKNPDLLSITRTVSQFLPYRGNSIGLNTVPSF